MLLKDKVAIITGAASARGLGFATAKLFAENGASVVIIDLNGEASKAAAAALGEGHLGLAANVADEVQVQAAIEQILAKYGRVDVLVNCAGVAPGEKIVGREGPHALDSFARAIGINLIGTFNMLRLAADAMSRNAPGHPELLPTGFTEHKVLYS